MILKCIVRCAALTFLTVSSANAASIVIYGASGNVGSKITTEALYRGHDVIGVGRDPSSMTFDHENFTAVSGDVTNVESMVEIIDGADVVIISVNGNGEGNLPENAIVNRAAQTFIAAAGRLGEAAPRVIQVGGGYTLYRDGQLLVDSLGLEVGHPRHGIYHGHIAAIGHYRASDVEWTVISPPPGPALQPGERTGIFRVGEDEVMLGANGEASISQEDLAVLFINEVEVPRAIGKRITIGY
ncbi:MAG TPA: NAD(P)H-binding protein [Gammaproteobacteria bacterium]